VPRFTLKQLLSSRVLIGDGAMGTMLYQHGVFLNRCFEELNFSDPKLVRSIHDSYIKAGADFIETNTFGANEIKLARYGLAGDVEKINSAGVIAARESASGEILIAGAMGPLGCELTQHGPVTRQEATNIFRRQAKVLVDAGVDFFILETFSNTEELLVAISAVSEVADLPIVAQMTVNENNETIYGERIDRAMSRIEQSPGVTAVGLNCSVGPSGMLSSLELIRAITNKPISVQPNAGLPRQVEGRTLYMCTPEYMAEYAKRFFEKGAKIIGGCCGTTPEHIKEIARVVRGLDKASVGKAQPRVSVIKASKPIALEPVPLAHKSKLGAKLAVGQKVATIELTPPRGIDISDTLDKARLCDKHGVDAINIPDGPRASSRLSAMVTAVKIQQHADIETILHFCCRDRNLIGMQSDILGACAMGVRNMLVVTGDPPKLGEYPESTGVFDMDSIALTGVIHNLNRGIDIGGNSVSPWTLSPATCLAIGVGANPVAAEPVMARPYQR